MYKDTYESTFGALKTSTIGTSLACILMPQKYYHMSYVSLHVWVSTEN